MLEVLGTDDSSVRRAVAEQRDGRNQDGKDGNRHGNRNYEWIVTALVMGLGQFDTSVHFDAFSL